MDRHEIKSKNFFTEPIISPKVDRVLLYVFSFLGAFAGIILKSVTSWSYWTILLAVVGMAVILVCLLKFGNKVWAKFKAKEKGS
ncbi:hypothetical protein [Planococcus salinus]|uniref:Uncharacterized protein n=1 Tax=Planococcus salinus TaxID=1848460 RepID=A0A3M8P6R3_9BACL|nr:hypothetical protein [Planococcus salinus]RNF38960.1 hypothetical protein EEX84_11230 [Planococcus salinus]